MSDWRAFAACRGEDPDLFFPAAESGAVFERQMAEAKAICVGCSVSEVCLTEALDNREPAGVWGGLSAAERALILRSRSRFGIQAAGLVDRWLSRFAESTRPTYLSGLYRYRDWCEQSGRDLSEPGVDLAGFLAAVEESGRPGPDRRRQIGVATRSWVEFCTAEFAGAGGMAVAS